MPDIHSTETVGNAESAPRGHTDYTDPLTIDIDTVIGNITHAFKVRGDKWTDATSWPNVTVLALANEVVALRREMEFAELLCDGGKITVNGVPWREMFERINKLVGDPIVRRGGV